MLDVQHESVALPGIWRLTGFGRLADAPLSGTHDPRILVNLAQIQPTSHESYLSGRLTGNLQTRLLPIGELPRLHLNSVMRDGMVISGYKTHLNFESVSSDQLDFSRDNLRIFLRYDEDDNQMVIPIRDKWGQLSDEANTAFVGIGSGEDPYSTIISAVEIFRFFYATSDIMAKACISDNMLQPNTHIWNPERTGIDKDGNAVLWLRRRMIDADARFIARFAFDEFALKEAQQIFLRIARAGPSQERLISALPPFADKVMVRFVYIPIPGYGVVGRRLVTRILQCDWRPPFKAISWGRDNDGRFDPDNREERPISNWSPSFVQIPLAYDDKFNSLRDTPISCPTPPKRLQEDEINRRFPNLGLVHVEKHPRFDAITKADDRDWKTLLQEVTGYSVIDGFSTTDLVGSAIIESSVQGESSAKIETTDVNIAIGEKDYRHVFELLRVIEQEGLANVSYILVLDHYATVCQVEVNVLPRKVDSISRAWLFVDETRTATRFVAVAHIIYSGKSRYLIEFQARQIGNKPSTLVVWDQTHSQIEHSVLRLLILECCKSGEASLQDAVFYNLCWGRLMHTMIGHDIVSARHYLKRIFNKKPVDIQV